LFQSLYVAQSRGVEQFLECSAIFQATLNFRDPRFGYIDGEAFALEMTGQDPAGMFFTTRASAATFTNAAAAAQTERAKSSRPEGGGMGLKPTLDIGERFRFALHVVYMSHNVHAMQERNIEEEK
jgi:hypothetical protein